MGFYNRVPCKGTRFYSRVPFKGTTGVYNRVPFKVVMGFYSRVPFEEIHKGYFQGFCSTGYGCWGILQPKVGGGGVYATIAITRKLKEPCW